MYHITLASTMFQDYYIKSVLRDILNEMQAYIIGQRNCFIFPPPPREVYILHIIVLNIVQVGLRLSFQLWSNDHWFSDLVSLRILYLLQIRYVSYTLKVQDVLSLRLIKVLPSVQLAGNLFTFVVFVFHQIFNEFGIFFIACLTIMVKLKKFIVSFSVFF